MNDMRVSAVNAVAVRHVCDWHFEDAVEKETERIEGWLAELEGFLEKEGVLKEWREKEGRHCFVSDLEEGGGGLVLSFSLDRME